MGIEPTPSHLRCAALPVELPSPLGARWWGVGYTNVSFLGANYILNTKFSDEHPSGDMLSPLALGWMLQPSGLTTSQIQTSNTCIQVPRFFSEEKISGLGWESNPHLHISGVLLYQLSYQACWEQGGGE